MVGRYHENCPELARPSTRAANAKELKFDRLDSAYAHAHQRQKRIGQGDPLYDLPLEGSHGLRH